jgi:hypothetical protein
MAIERLEYTIRKEGTVEEKVEGIPGPKCIELTASFEDAIGPVVERVYTAEYSLVPDSKKVKEQAKVQKSKVDS